MPHHLFEEVCMHFARLSVSGCTLGVLLAALVALSAPAMAMPKVALSVGQGVLFKDGAHATAVQGELTGSWSFALVQADLGLLQELTKTRDLMLTPGLRLNLLSLFVKAGLPMRMSGNFDWGFRLGAGWTMLSLGVVGLFVEVDAMFWKDYDFKDYVPITGRLGLEIGF